MTDLGTLERSCKMLETYEVVELEFDEIVVLD